MNNANIPDTLYIDGVKIGVESPVYFIADIAANHDGNLNKAKDLIFKAAESGANAAKFQHFSAKNIVSDHGFKTLEAGLSHQSSWKKSVFQVYEEASLRLDWTSELKSACDSAGITFFTSPYDLEIVNFIDSYVPAYKIGSGDITWIELIEHIAKKNKPYILATGASSFDEVVYAIENAIKINPAVCLLQCNTNYTANIENYKYIQLNVIQSYRKMYPKMILGLSDHTLNDVTVLGAVALGAKIIEKHFTDNRLGSGPDHAFSIDPKSWSEMVMRCRELELSLGNGVKKIEQNEMQSVIIQRRAIRAARDLNKGEVIAKSDLSFLRPCPESGLKPIFAKSLVGKLIRRDIKSGDLVTWNDLD